MAQESSFLKHRYAFLFIVLISFNAGNCEDPTCIDCFALMASYFPSMGSVIGILEVMQDATNYTGICSAFSEADQCFINASKCFDSITELWNKFSTTMTLLCNEEEVRMVIPEYSRTCYFLPNISSCLDIVWDISVNADLSRLAELDQCWENYGHDCVDAAAVNLMRRIMTSMIYGSAPPSVAPTVTTAVIDVNKCLTDNGGCDVNADCANGIGSDVACACRSGFTGDGFQCTDINECLSFNGGCDAHADCSNNVGSFQCACKHGFDGNGFTCSDINECLSFNGGCDAHADCSNNVGSFQCACKRGFDGNGFTCSDINECLTRNGGCVANAVCTNNVGSFQCTCKRGFKGNGFICTDINECLTRNGGCDANADCTNSVGSFQCACQLGFSGNGFTCTGPECASLVKHTEPRYTKTKQWQTCYKKMCKTSKLFKSKHAKKCKDLLG